jgi:hypothetical protein
MKAIWMAGAAAALVWVAPALADDDHYVPPPQPQTTTTTTTDQTTTPVTTPAPAPAAAPVYDANGNPVQPAYVQPVAEVPVEKKDRNVMRGVTLLVGGGVEGYTGALASEIRPGETWGVEAAVKPTKVLGLEIGYTGAANNVASSYYDVGTNASGPDIIRNGGHAVATVGLSASAVQPYLLGGVALDHFSIRNAQAAGFQDANNGNIPLGAGLRGHAGNFTADLRFDYRLPLNQSFAPGISSGDLGAGRYQGMLQVGATF